MEIRLLQPKDAAMYRELRLEALKNNPEAFSSSFAEEKEYPIEKYKDRLTQEHFYTFGAFMENELKGVVTLIVETKIKIKHRATIVAMYVNSSNRKCGIGKSLISEVIKKANDIKAVEQIYLTVNSSNTPAKKLYQSFGFDTYGTDKSGLKIADIYYDEELMVLYL